MTDTNAGPSRQSFAGALDQIEAARLRRPRLTDDTITLAHGAGGKASAALLDAVFLEAFGRPQAEPADAATLVVEAGRIAFSTDSYVVNPIFFPGGSIGELAVNGTVNDLAVMGAQPRWLSAAFVIEEGLPVAELQQVVAAMAQAAEAAGVTIVTGDTKVVPRGAADRLYITTAGVGIIPDGRQLGVDQVELGDKVILSGPVAAHGMAVMMARGNLALAAEIDSDTAPLNGGVEALYAGGAQVHWMRDATRGGLATVANELAQASGYAVLLDEEVIPVDPQVRGACDMLGIDPLYVANEGCFMAVVDPASVAAALAGLQQAGFPRAVAIGEIIAEPAGVVAVRNGFGGLRLADMLTGDPLPRIC